MAVYKSEVTIRNTRDTLYEFFLNPNNLVDVTLPELKLNIVAAPERVEAGSAVEFEVTHFGQAIKAKHEVVSVEDFCITEKQVDGAMKQWEQERRFVEVDGESCRIENTVTFEGPGGLIGVIMSEQKILSTLEKGFEYQNQKLQERFDGATS